MAYVSRAERIFTQNPEPQKLQAAFGNSRFFTKNAAMLFAQRFEKAPLLANMFSELADSMEETTSQDVSLLFEQLKRTLLYPDSPNRVTLYDHTTAPTGIQLNVRTNGIANPSLGVEAPSQSTDPYVTQAYTIKTLLTQRAPSMINQYKIDDPNSLGFHLDLLPGIPEGVVILYQNGYDAVVKNNTQQGGIRYHKFTLIDARTKKPTQKPLTLWEVDDRRDQGSPGEYHYFVIPEILSNQPEEFVTHWQQDPFISGIKRRGIISHEGRIFGHLPGIS